MKKLPLLLITLFITNFAIFAQTQILPVYAPINGNSNNVSLLSEDGSNVEALFDLESLPHKISIDGTNEKIYWLDQSNLKIQRSNFDGSNVEDVVVDLELSADAINNAFELQVIPSASKIFWLTNAQVFSADLDGSNMTTNLSADNLSGFLIDDDGQSFWYLIQDPATFTNTLYKYDITQQTNTSLQTGLSYSTSFVKLDGSLFWRSFDGIEKTDLDGANPELVLSTSLILFEALPATSELIWYDGTGYKKANTSDYAVSVVSNETYSDIADIATNPVNGTFYISRIQNRERVLSMNANTGDIETIVSVSIGTVADVQMDLEEQIVYLADISGYVVKWDLTTGEQEEIYSTPNRIFSIAYSSEHKRLLVQETSDQNINSLILIDIDGNIENQREILGLALAMGFIDKTQQIYWKDFSGFNVSDYAGTDVSPILNSLSTAFIPDIIFDEVNDKIYYLGQADIYVSDLDGSNLETIITGLFIPLQMVIDPYEGYIYYATFNPPNGTAFNRVKLDGTDSEIIYASDIPTLQMSIAIDVPTSSEDIVSPEEFGVKVFPNPVVKGEMIQIQLDELKPTTIRVYNSVGMLILEQNSNDFNSTISTDNLDQGFYIMELVQDGIRTTHTINVAE